jgi:hypothetical protein
MPDRPGTTPPPATEETRRDWEEVQNNGDSDKTERLRVLSGWLYRSIVEGNVALVFIPGRD